MTVLDEDHIAHAARLGGGAAQDGLPVLLPLLGNPNWRVRHAAVEALVTLSPRPDVAQALWESLRDPEDAGRRNAALVALSRLGRDALPVLLKVATSPTADHRKLAVDALGLLGDSLAVDQLALSIKDPDANVRAAAAEALGRMVHPAAVTALQQHLAAIPPTDPLEVTSVVLALARARAAPPWTVLAPLLEDLLTGCAAVTLLPYSHAPEASSALRNALSGESGALRAAALGAVCSAGLHAPGVAAVTATAAGRAVVLAAALEGVAGRDEETASSAAAVAGWVADDTTASRLLLHRAGRPWDAAVASAWARGGPDVALHVAGALPRMEPEDQALALELLAVHPDRRVGPSLAALWMGASGELLDLLARAWLLSHPTGAVEPLVLRLVDPTVDQDDRATCARALLDCAAQSPAVVRQAVLPLLRTSLVVPQVCHILAAAAAPEDHPQLLEWLRHPTPAVRAAACEGLAVLRASEDAELVLPALLDEHPEVRAAAVTALGILGNASHVNAVLARTADDDATVQRAALAAATRLDPKSAQERLLAVVSNGPAHVAEAALEAAERQGGSQAFAAGARGLAHPDVGVVRAALRAVAAARTQDAVSLVLPLLKDPRWEVRHAAAQAVAGLRRESLVDAATLGGLRVLVLAEQDPLVREAMNAALGDAP